MRKAKAYGVEVWGDTGEVQERIELVALGVVEGVDGLLDYRRESD